MFSRFVVLIGSVSTLLLLAGCASGPQAPNPGLKESFHTEIFPNGAKRFTYSLEMATPQLRGPYTEQPNMRAGTMRSEPVRGTRREARVDIDNALQLKMTETGFCRDGFFVIDRVVSRMGGEVRGECRDGVERR